MSFALGCTGLFFAVFFLGTSAPFFKGFEMICFFPTLLYKVMFLQGIFFFLDIFCCQSFCCHIFPPQKVTIVESPGIFTGFQRWSSPTKSLQARYAARCCETGKGSNELYGAWLGGMSNHISFWLNYSDLKHDLGPQMVV